MGINPDDFELGPEVRAHMKLLSNAYCSNGRKIIISIDRLDLCKVSYHTTDTQSYRNYCMMHGACTVTYFCARTSLYGYYCWR
jgi:hypothetical protein